MRFSYLFQAYLERQRSGSYSHVPTVVGIYMNEINFTDVWYEMLVDYIKPAADKVYLGDNTQV